MMAVFSEVHGAVLNDVAHLLGGHASEAEHSNLVSDVLPVVRAALLSKSFPQGCPHTDDPVRHSLHVLHPFLPEGGMDEGREDYGGQDHRYEDSPEGRTC